MTCYVQYWLQKQRTAINEIQEKTVVGPFKNTVEKKKAKNKSQVAKFFVIHANAKIEKDGYCKAVTLLANRKREKFCQWQGFLG